MRILSASRQSVADPGRLWIQLVQKHLEKLLLVGRTKTQHLPPEEWRTVKTRWKELVQDACPELRGLQGQPVSARVLGEVKYDGFRLQKIVLEAMPGWQIGLNLFLPLGEGPFTPILCPCGHGPKWQDDHQLPPQVLARNGFAAALFDSPMFGERARDNDHFIQGAQAQMYGLWSAFFFLLDPIRVADYLQARPDITFAHGMGVTGVSGGGYSTLYLPQYDDRVKAIVPVCAVTPLEAFPIHGLYTGCPENYVKGQALLGMDYDDLLALASPLPCLVIGGTRDELFHTAHMRHSVQKAKAIYAREEAEERLASWYEECEHRYTPAMAGKAAEWFRQWLLGEEGRIDTFAYALPREALDCGTAETTDGMLQHHRREAARARKGRRMAGTDEAIRQLLNLHDDPRPAAVETIVGMTEWGPEGLSRRVVRGEEGMPLPLLDLACPEAPAGTLVCFSDQGKLGPLRQAGGFCGLCRRIVSADLRGFGELAPEPSEYDIYGWCGIDRVLADLLWLSGETAMGQQVRDALRVLDTATDEGLTVYGHGEAALPALFAGLLHPGVHRIVLEDFPCSFQELATAAKPAWSRWQFLPDVLKYFDLPELLAERAEKAFLLINPCDARKERLDEVEALRLYGLENVHITVHVDFGAADTPATLREWLRSADCQSARDEGQLARIGNPRSDFPPKYLGADLTGRAELRKVTEAIATRTLFRHYGLGQPAMAETLEARVREKFGSAFALGVTSGSAALNVALAGLGVGPGDEVILPAFAWHSCYQAIVLHGAVPVFCEIDRSLNISPQDVKRKITPRTKAIIAVHYQGAVAGVEELLAIARPQGIRVLEDCAQAMGAQYHGQYAGAVGDVGTFSLQGNKMLTAGEGGLVITSDPAVFERAVRYHDLGFLRPTFEAQLKQYAENDSAWMRNKSHSQGLHDATPGEQADQNTPRRHDVGAPTVAGRDSWHPGLAFPGNQYRMNELTAAVALAQLERLDWMAARCRRAWTLLRERIRVSLPDARFRRSNSDGDLGIALFLDLQTPERAAEFSAALAAEGIPLGPTSGMTNLLDCGYIRQAGYAPDLAPNTPSIVDSMVAIPITPRYTAADAEEIAGAVVKAYRGLLVSQ
ncbi:MAG: aminotransferase class V-fold PLP-dependent enzyme [Armatimonadota bacterium]